MPYRFGANLLWATTLVSACTWACDLRITDAWIREPPPGAMMLAGYAKLANIGQTTLTIATLHSPLFGRIEMHESAQHNGVMQMRPLPSLAIAAGAALRFEPDGKHFMLINPARALKHGDRVPIQLTDNAGCVTMVDFSVGAPGSDTAGALPEKPAAMDMKSMK